MAKVAFTNGSLDKSGKHVKTDKGWVPIKGNEHLVNDDQKTKIVAPKEKAEKPAPAKKAVPAKKKTAAPAKKAAKK